MTKYGACTLFTNDNLKISLSELGMVFGGEFLYEFESKIHFKINGIGFKSLLFFQIQKNSLF